MPIEPFPAAAFADHVCELASRLPLLFRRQLKAISELHAPRPQIFTSGWKQWSNARDRVITKALAEYAGERLGVVEVNSGRPVPIEGPIHCSWKNEAAFDVAMIATRMKERAIDKELDQHERVYYSPMGPLSEIRPTEALRDVLFQLSFAETKALDHFTGIYLWLLRQEPEVAASYGYSVRARDGEIDYGDILADYRMELDRHWIQGNPETASVIRIDRGFGPIRIISFVRPIPAQALARIERRLSEAGQPFEIW